MNWLRTAGQDFELMSSIDVYFSYVYIGMEIKPLGTAYKPRSEEFLMLNGIFGLIDWVYESVRFESPTNPSSSE